MDNLTHTAVGLFLSRAGLNRLTPRASAILLLAANAPDIDVVSAFGGGLNYLHWHRNITHAFAAAPVLAVLVVALVRFAGRKPVNWIGGLVAALIGLASHFALDWTNVYGVRLLLPFSGEWLQGDLNNVVDLCIWSVCLIGVAGPFLSRLVGSEITSGGAAARHHGRGWAIFALLFLFAYDGARATMHTRAVATLSSRLYEGAVPLRVIACPDTANPFRWRGVVETPGAYIVEDVNLVSTDPGEARATVYHKPDPEPAIDAARRDRVVAEFLRFSQYPLWRVTPWPEIDNARLVEVFDMRFGSPSSPGFMARAVVNERGQVVESSFRFGTPRAR
ncbi:MAG: metal-dependent hydrolase [Acidobacteria bacterium]|nr:metal-dependent hydrolase [Acidobacteriota bacterium]